MEKEFEAVKKIMDVLSKNWSLLAPDTKIWLKSRLEKLPTGKVQDIDDERN